MKLENEKVSHIRYGVGEIMEVKDEHRILVHFEKTNEDKMFQYPEAFEKFLQFTKAELQEEAYKELDRLEEEKEALEEQERIKQARMERYKKQFLEQFLKNQRAQHS